MNDFDALKSLVESRRSIVSLFLHYALSMVAMGRSNLCIDEESALSIIRNAGRENKLKNVQYSGPVDFVVGHSRTIEFTRIFYLKKIYVSHFPI